MTPSVEPNAPAAEVPAAAQLLQDGEVVLLAVKPSVFFVLLTSWPVLAAGAVVAAGAYVAARQFHVNVPAGAVMLLCLAVACARLLWACAQWVGTLYLLTNRRVMRIRGLTNPDIADCPLKAVREIVLAAGVPERALGLGNLLFHLGGGEASPVAWVAVARPEDLRQAIEEAIRRAR